MEIQIIIVHFFQNIMSPVLFLFTKGKTNLLNIQERCYMPECMAFYHKARPICSINSDACYCDQDESPSITRAKAFFTTNWAHSSIHQVSKKLPPSRHLKNMVFVIYLSYIWNIAIDDHNTLPQRTWDLDSLQLHQVQLMWACSCKFTNGSGKSEALKHNKILKHG